MRAEAPSRRNLTIAILARLLAAVPALGLLFFLPAGTLAYWEAWVYMAVILIPIATVAIYLLKNDPGLRENSYASRTVKVEQEQEVITSGPYSVVRHPMYLGILLTYGFSPLALGSYWGMIPMILLPVLLAARIRNEEQILRKELEGYQAYTRRVKYRLIPGVW